MDTLVPMHTLRETVKPPPHTLNCIINCVWGDTLKSMYFVSLVWYLRPENINAVYIMSHGA